MKKILLFLTILFSIVGILLTVLPLETLTLIPIGLSLFFAYLSSKRQEVLYKKISNWLLFISVAMALLLIAKGIK